MGGMADRTPHSGAVADRTPPGGAALGRLVIAEESGRVPRLKQVLPVVLALHVVPLEFVGLAKFGQKPNR